MHKKILATAVLAALPVWAQAGDLSLGRVYGTVGILNGIGVGLGSQWNKDWGFRTELATISYDKNTSESGVDYSADLSGTNVSFFADYFPFNGLFRLTAGLGVLGTEVDFTAVGNGQSATIGGATVTLASNDRIDASVEFPSVAPYLGLGWGQNYSNTGWFVSADLGVYVGGVDTSFNVSQSLQAKAGAANVEAERREFEEAVGDYDVIPALSIAVGYQF